MYICLIAGVTKGWPIRSTCSAAFVVVYDKLTFSIVHPRHPRHPRSRPPHTHTRRHQLPSDRTRCARSVLRRVGGGACTPRWPTAPHCDGLGTCSRPVARARQERDHRRELRHLQRLSGDAQRASRSTARSRDQRDCRHAQRQFSPSSPPPSLNLLVTIRTAYLAVMRSSIM